MYLLLILIMLWRIGLFIIAWIGSFKFPFTPSFPYSEGLLVNSALPSWIWSFANFDGVHYISIAKSGYIYQFTQVFFPLYPLIVGLFHKIFPFFHIIISGLLISNISFFIAIYIFSKLLNLDYKKSIVYWTISFLLVFPTSFFFGSFYTEGPFFLFIIASFYFARQKRWWLAALLGAIASATRFPGIFLLPALLWEKYQEYKLKNKKISLISYLLSSPVVYLVPMGLIIYMIYLQLNFGDALYFWHNQPVFGAERSGNSFVLLPQVLWRYSKILLTVSHIKYEFWVALSELLFTLYAIILLFTASLKKIRPSYLIFSWLTVLIPTFSGTLSSMPRYVLIAFPVYITLALLKSRLLKLVLFVLSIIFFIIYTVVFTRGLWVG